MKLADYCGTAHSYIGEIEAGRKFPSMDLIEKIAKTLKIEPYLFFKSRTGKNGLVEISQGNSRMAYSAKKQLQKQVKNHIKSRINFSTNQILNEVNDIIEKY
ncbi:MAG: helix-turn-helix transcriptional regulator [Treponema sp.]|nr:helix-turn-helix transcriptional regulator [Treponema sp.]